MEPLARSPLDCSRGSLEPSEGSEKNLLTDEGDKVPFYLAARSPSTLLRVARQTQKFCLRDLRRQKPQSLRDTIHASA